MTADPLSQAENMPPRIARLPRDRTGRPVPWFIRWHEGIPYHRIERPGARRDAYRHNLCFICGVKFAGKREHRAFVIGPSRAMTRSAEQPPSHIGCATYAVTHCPFLANPGFKRRDTYPDWSNVDAIAPPGTTRANWGVAAVWVTDGNGSQGESVSGIKDIRLTSDPIRIDWYTRGRKATRDEVMERIRAAAVPGVKVDQLPEYKRILPRLPAAGLFKLPTLGGFQEHRPEGPSTWAQMTRNHSESTETQGGVRL